MFLATGTIFDRLSSQGFRQVDMAGFAVTPLEDR